MHHISTSLVIVALLITGRAASATVKVSVEDGAWSEIRWLPGGTPPGPGDTAIVSSHVSSMPPGRFAPVIVNNVGTLEMGPGGRTLAGLRNDGRVRLDSLATLVIDGDLDNAGSITGGRHIQLSGDGATVRSRARLGRLVIAIPGGGDVRLEGDIAATALSVVGGSRLDLGVHDLVIESGVAASLTRVSIVASTGRLIVRGDLRGVVDASVTLAGNVAAGRDRDPPVVSGLIGGEGRSVEIHGRRLARFCRFVGTVVVAPDGELIGDGIGLRATNAIVGAVVVEGVLGATDENYVWHIEGDIVTRGAVEGCVLEVVGEQRSIDARAGRWDGTVRLFFRGTNEGRLRIEGDIDLSTLEIAGIDGADTNVAVLSEAGTVRIRHRFISDIAASCRLECARTVHLFDEVDGIVRGNVVVGGFWGSPISGTLGGEGDTVWITMPKLVAGELAIDGALVQRRRGRLDVASRLTLPAGAVLSAENVIRVGGAIAAYDTLEIERDLSGGGTLEVNGGAGLLRIRAALRDSITLRVGVRSGPSTLTIDGEANIARISVAAGSVIALAPMSTLTVPGSFRQGLSMSAGFQLVSAAAIPPGGSAVSAFPGADSDLFAFDEGYVATDVVEPGHGYWVSYALPLTIEQEGAYVAPDVTVAVKAGWNLIGCPSVLVDVGALRPVGTTILSGPFDDASMMVLRMEPGRAYWIEAATAGEISFR